MRIVFCIYAFESKTLRATHRHSKPIHHRSLVFYDISSIFYYFNIQQFVLIMLIRRASRCSPNYSGSVSRRCRLSPGGPEQQTGPAQWPGQQVRQVAAALGLGRVDQQLTRRRRLTIFRRHQSQRSLRLFRSIAGCVETGTLQQQLSDTGHSISIQYTVDRRGTLLLVFPHDFWSMGLSASAHWGFIQH